MQEYIKKINIGNVEVKNNVFLGPMAGVTDIAFRTICREFGPGLTFTEMASTKAMEFDSKKTKDLLKIPDNERPSVVQIFGSNKDVIGNTIKKLNEEESIDIIDINMGCPAPKLVKNGDGAGLLLNIKNVEEILNEAVGNPWIFKSILEGKDYVPSKEELYETIIKHINLMREIDGEKQANLKLRKHVAWYLKGLKSSTRVKDMVNRAENIEEVFNILSEYFKNLEENYN